MKINLNLVSSSKYSIKCPHPLTVKYITVHNTANDASAKNEISYMVSNDKQTSFHFAVDDKEVWQGLPLDRNGYHAGDVNGPGNRQSIGVEICYSKSGGERFDKAEINAAWLIAKLLKDFNLTIDKVKKHQDWSGKNCPQRTLELGWIRFLNLISNYMDQDMSETTDELKKRIAYLESEQVKDQERVESCRTNRTNLETQVEQLNQQIKTLKEEFSVEREALKEEANQQKDVHKEALRWLSETLGTTQDFAKIRAEIVRCIEFEDLADKRLKEITQANLRLTELTEDNKQLRDLVEDLQRQAREAKGLGDATTADLLNELIRRLKNILRRD